ncbi:hypothetical protein OS189_12325 [Sulfitobacter sp. F26169L]|uniref:hypothetical protein n=1 Tax=Sulfitobacter sp. F26169L TaxID=2996015 RepID=UPI002260EA59|nr:hypothetical protein [Sulfitobacter sp. F26169L]MCX7567130.1 hypothetical protein [Sulfitobacter sp. F26169L]
MSDTIFSVGQAAEWLADSPETQEHAANQLRRFRAKGYVQTQGQFGSGPTAAHKFNVHDLATAKLCQGVMRFGIKKEAILRAVSDACYTLPVMGGDITGIEAAFSDPRAAWCMIVFFHANADGTESINAQMCLGMDGLERLGGQMIVLTLTDWLPALAEMQGA